MFDVEKFKKYMYNEFPDVFRNNRYYEREWLDNVLEYATEHFSVYEEFEAFMISIVPELVPEDLRKFR